MDLSIYHSLNDFAYRHGIVGGLARFFASDAIFITFGVLALVCLVGGRRAFVRDRWAIVAGAVSAVIALGIGAITGDGWHRARPFVHHAHHLLVSHAADASFPSDHVTALAAVTFALLFRRRPLGWAVLAVTILVAVARVMVGVHYPTDVLGGAGDGLLVAGALSLRPLRDWIDRLVDAVAIHYDRLFGGRPRAAEG
jgi:membrane-associated phospholipid phosphatase